jgi:hypothetical protein
MDCSIETCRVDMQLDMQHVGHAATRSMETQWINRMDLHNRHAA